MFGYEGAEAAAWEVQQSGGSGRPHEGVLTGGIMDSSMHWRDGEQLASYNRVPAETWVQGEGGGIWLFNARLWIRTG